MRLLIDECLPRQLKVWLSGKHDVVTVQEMGWANVKNGLLLRSANQASFDVFVTADQNLYYQQNFSGMQISAIVIPSNRKLLVQKSVPAFLQSLDHVKSGQKIIMNLGPDSDAWHTLRLHAIEQQEQYTLHIFKQPRAEERP